MSIRIREEEVEGRPVDYEHVCETTLQQVSDSLAAIDAEKQEDVWNWRGVVSGDNEGEVSANKDGVAVSLLSEDREDGTDEQWVVVRAGSAKLEVFRIVGDDSDLGGLEEVGHESLADCDELGRMRSVVQGAHRDIVGVQSLMEF